MNKAKVQEARAAGLMQPPGEAVIAEAKANWMWSFLDDVEAGIVPDDLARALDAAAARPNWDGYPRSVKRGTLEWIKTARTAPTRARRIADVVKNAAKGARPTPFLRG